MFKKTKKVELTAEELVNLKLNKEKLARAGFGYHEQCGLYEIVLNKTVLVPENMLKLDWADLKRQLLMNQGDFTEALKQRLEV